MDARIFRDVLAKTFPTYEKFYLQPDEGGKKLAFFNGILGGLGVNSESEITMSHDELIEWIHGYFSEENGENGDDNDSSVDASSYDETQIVDALDSRQKKSHEHPELRRGYARVWRRYYGEDIEFYITPEADIKAILRNIQELFEETQRAQWISEKEAAKSPVLLLGSQHTTIVDKIIFTTKVYKSISNYYCELWSDGRQYATYTTRLKKDIEAIAGYINADIRNEPAITCEGPFRVTYILENKKPPKKDEMRTYTQTWDFYWEFENIGPA